VKCPPALCIVPCIPISNWQFPKLSTIILVLSLSRQNSSLVLQSPFSAGEDMSIRLSCAACIYGRNEY
jgi:hypothetical protein